MSFIKRIPKLLFRLSDGSVPDNWNKPFRQWLEDSELLNCPVTGKERSLYSLRNRQNQQFHNILVDNLRQWQII